VCKFFGNYLLTGSEDTQLILSKLKENLIDHQFHLKGHDSVVKCFQFMPINSNETLLVSAGGKANIKIWKLISNELNEIIKIVHLYEFKRQRPKKNEDETKKKPWLYTDLKSNPDIRFMDVEIVKMNLNQFLICFVCSDGLIRLVNKIIEIAEILKFLTLLF
jgi:WD40 repeat protein